MSLKIFSMYKLWDNWHILAWPFFSFQWDFNILCQTLCIYTFEQIFIILSVNFDWFLEIDPNSDKCHRRKLTKASIFSDKKHFISQIHAGYKVTLIQVLGICVNSNTWLVWRHAKFTELCHGQHRHFIPSAYMSSYLLQRYISDLYVIHGSSVCGRYCYKYNKLCSVLQTRIEPQRYYLIFRFISVGLWILLHGDYIICMSQYWTIFSNIRHKP